LEIKNDPVFREALKKRKPVRIHLYSLGQGFYLTDKDFYRAGSPILLTMVSALCLKISSLPASLLLYPFALWEGAFGCFQEELQKTVKERIFGHPIRICKLSV
jgi:hypothetical protein